MPIAPERIDAAVGEIEAALAGVPHPGDDRLLHPQCRDDLDIREFRGSLDWRDVPSELIVRNYAAPSFFSAHAFRYYMPAFMIWTLRHYGAVEYAAESTVCALDPGTDRELLYDFQVSKFALFTPAQRSAVIRFLHTLADDAYLGPLAESALLHYWRDAA